MNPTIISGLERNRQVKDYIRRHFGDESEVTRHALQRSEEAGLKPIQVPVSVAKTLSMIAKLTRPKTILEIGTLGGYSALWLIQGMVQGGRLTTIECEEKHVAIAKKNFAFAGIEDQIEIRQGLALDVLDEMIEREEGPFDLISIDGDKREYPDYLRRVLKLAQSKAVILSDNMIPKRGEIGCPDPRDLEAMAIYLFNQMLADHPALETIPLTTIVGENGRIDSTGFTIVRGVE
ncbi:MAG: putative O-methyltransferase [Chlamydiae bacterium]|nr:putative O-methyltransferase [Chlamydiota bacterium]